MNTVMNTAMNTAFSSRPTLSALLLLITVGFNTPTFAQPELSGTPDELRGFLFPIPNTVTISGEGELTAYKDIARVNLRVTTEARELSTAMETNESLRQALIDEFIAAGIDGENINNARFASSPQSNLFGRSSYEVMARLQVEVTSESHLQILAAAADQNDEVEFGYIEFEHSEKDVSEQQVREQALQDVMSQKDYYEGNLGLQLRVINFYYGGIRQRARPMAASRLVEEALDVASSAVTSIAAPAVAPSFDEVEYQTSVTVVFEIISEED